MKTLFSLLIIMLALHTASADTDHPPEYYELIEEIRCLVCQNQSIADSSAPLALDMRSRVERLLNEGYSKEEVKLHLSERFGDYLLYDPKLGRHTYLLWFGPFIFMAVLLFTLVFRGGQKKHEG